MTCILVRMLLASYFDEVRRDNPAAKQERTSSSADQPDQVPVDGS